MAEHLRIILIAIFDPNILVELSLSLQLVHLAKKLAEVPLEFIEFHLKKQY